MCTRQADAMRADTVATARFPTPFGDGLVAVSRGLLVAVDLPHTVTGAIAAVWGSAADAREGAALEDLRALDRWKGELAAYFAGENLAWVAKDIPLDALPVNDFSRAVYEALLEIPPGETVSYGALAERAGFPRAARAVGTAMATNPVPLVIPCHRVVRSDGTLGRYGSDPAWKAYLLSHESRYAPGGCGGAPDGCGGKR